MPDKVNLNTKIEPDQPEVYQIRIKGHLSSLRRDWFDGLTITLEDNGDIEFTFQPRLANSLTTLR